jgi:hypothetical protein
LLGTKAGCWSLGWWGSEVDSREVDDKLGRVVVDDHDLLL